MAESFATGSYLLVNFGGPRSPEEIEPFLKEILKDRDVIRTKFPTWLHNWLFGRIAEKRAEKVRLDYEKIGFSPIYDDTETLKRILEVRLGSPSSRSIATFLQPIKKLYRPLKRANIQSGSFPFSPNFVTEQPEASPAFSLIISERAQDPNSTGSNLTQDHPEFISAWQKRDRPVSRREWTQGKRNRPPLFSAWRPPFFYRGGRSL